MGEEQLLAPYHYICKMPGKQVRSRLAAAFNCWLRIEEDKLRRIMSIVEMLHNASLMIDDIEDSSILRRGLPVTHSIYGVPRTINTANFVYFKALDECTALGHPGAVKIFIEEMLELHRGQGKELFWRDTVQCPSRSEYEVMVTQKTGGLFRLAVNLMQLFSSAESAHTSFGPLICIMACYFQIRDDYINLCSEDYAEQKSFAEDLTEGKFSFPIIHALGGRGSDDEILNIIRQRTKDVEVKKYCIKILHKRGAISFTRDFLKKLFNKIAAEVERLGGNEPLMALMQSLDQGLYAESVGGLDGLRLEPDGEPLPKLSDATDVVVDDHLNLQPPKTDSYRIAVENNGDSSGSRDSECRVE